MAGRRAKPTASALNYLAGASLSNMVTVKIGSNGKVRVANNSGSVHVIVDTFGYYT